MLHYYWTQCIYCIIIHITITYNELINEWICKNSLTELIYRLEWSASQLKWSWWLLWANADGLQLPHNLQKFNFTSSSLLLEIMAGQYHRQHTYIHVFAYGFEKKYFHRILIHNYSMSYLISKMKLKQSTTTPLSL